MRTFGDLIRGAALPSCSTAAVVARASNRGAWGRTRYWVFREARETADLTPSSITGSRSGHFQVHSRLYEAPRFERSPGTRGIALAALCDTLCLVFLSHPGEDYTPTATPVGVFAFGTCR